ncbi:YHYH domain-containing protein [Magnetovirga frankeli]|uniref:YHYH domain-containing protein n=1 Tax=Magnetovirga frankeli TaxID=947516 RepID=UPI0012939D1D|nr:YHYH domain-containing protein [gamma proteobacterium SS-5]
MKNMLFAFTFILMSMIGTALAGHPNTEMGHSGGTDSKGCHYDHKNGGYHCH